MLAIIQARSNSKRFKNKVMFPIYGKPIIQHVINRVKKSKFVKKLVVATSNNIKDDQLADYLSKLKVNIYRGELKNVSRRMLDVANLYKAKYFIRISGDSPLIDHKLIDKLGGIYNKHRGKYEIITNVFPWLSSAQHSSQNIKLKQILN